MKEDKEQNEETVNNTEEMNNENTDSSTDSEIKEEVKPEPTAEEKYAELNNKYLRIHAEFDNYRKRTNKEKIDIIGNASASVLKDMIPVIDDFERAILNNKDVDDATSIKQGFELIYNKFLNTLKSRGLTPMDSIGQDFNPDIHEAIANVPAPKKKQKGKVIDAVEKGYTLNDKVIRFAKVVVGQ
ncbi:MAG TPA: nucleotide exchange factor GrpE [Crocinitomicaceae bacterium]|nr:nucleotide exchange factor GrpE [Crocinitomicaceae bacterium]